MAGYRVYDNGVLDAGAGTPYDAWDTRRTDVGPAGAVAAAMPAANPHNTQPWRFLVHSNGAEVFGDPGRRLVQVNPLLPEHHIGRGIAVGIVVLRPVEAPR